MVPPDVIYWIALTLIALAVVYVGHEIRHPRLALKSLVWAKTRGETAWNTE